MSMYDFYDADHLDDVVFQSAGDPDHSQLQETEAGDGAIQHLKMGLHKDPERNLAIATFEVPGMKKEDIQIVVQNGQLTVTAESKVSEELTKQGYAIRERRFGRYSGTLQLPASVKEDKIKVGLEDGILTVVLPNWNTTSEEAPKKISIE